MLPWQSPAMTKERWTSSSRAKLARADEHLDVLHRKTSAWGDGAPLVVTRKSNADGSEHIWSLHFKPQPDVWRWSVLLGAGLTTLRCALDHMVFALAIAQPGKNPPADETK